MEWTTQQQEAIEYRNNNVLLAAAAGSGKTAVLVERIIRLIKDEGVSVNQLLVLTFTDAAAGEMREKIKKAILGELKANPENQHLQRQKLLIHSSSISTIHSFCMNLLKSHIHETNLPVDFALVEDFENTMILESAMNEVLERHYANIHKIPAFRDLVMGYGGIKNDRELRKLIKNLHNYSRSMAYPEKWLNGAIRDYAKVMDCGVIKDCWWMEQLQASVGETRDELFELYDQMLESTADTLGEDHPYMRILDGEIADLRRIFEHLDTDSYRSMRDNLQQMSYKTFKGVNKPEDDVKQAQNKIVNLRDAAKDLFLRLRDSFGIEEQEAVRRISDTYPVVKALKNIVLMVDRCYTRKKLAKSFLDFNDLEHHALHLLVDKNGNETEVAKSLREKYTAILVDEYQDTNNVQDTIFRTVSRDNSNIFMVGDLKQSIYKFRNAVPRLFSDKYEQYGKESEKGHLIRLFMNFRSRASVVNTVNFAFKTLMSPRVGDISYTEEEYLIQGAPYPETSEPEIYDSEFYMICTSSEQDVEEDGVLLEARTAADRIKTLIRERMPVFDKESGKMRPIEYRDIVILMRKTKGIAPIFERAFEESGIPAYSNVGHSYLSSVEIQTVLSYLQIIDNPRQDIPLIAVLRSPVWGFSTEVLADMRCKMPDGCFYDVVKNYAAQGDGASAEFLNVLEQLRRDSEYKGVDSLISYICYELGYYAYVGSMPSGRERQANLRVLLERATEFEHTGLNGLFSFMNYINTIISAEKDLTPAKAYGEGDNVVKIMSIHKSKGLEFPVVFLVSTANSFNLRDASNAIIWDEKGGIAVDFVDTDMRVSYPSLPKMLVAQKLKGDMISEEMRLLYVALTRAREKLIVTCTYKERDKKWRKPVWDSGKIVPPSHTGTLHSYREWLTSVCLLHPAASELRDFCEIPQTSAVENVDFGLKVHHYADAADVPEISAEREVLTDEERENDLRLLDEAIKRLDFEYKGGRVGLPTKLSVSEVKRMKADDEEYVPLIEPLRRSDMMEFNSVSGAERGTVVHFVMQMANPAEINGVGDVEALVERMVQEKIISQAQADAVNCRRIAEFFGSRIGQRLRNAVRRENEFSFYTETTADDIYQNGSMEKILLQGTIDCFFVEEDGKTVLLDFKTDRAKDGADALRVAGRYAVQMKYYEKALTEILGKAVDESYIYFLSCGELISAKKLMEEQ